MCITSPGQEPDYLVKGEEEIMTTANRRMMAKSAITTADLVAGGKLDAQRAKSFIDYSIDNTTIMKQCTVIRMTSDTYTLDEMGVNQRTIRKGVEVTAPTFTAGITTGKRQLQVTEIILPYDIGFQFLEDNLEKQGAEDHIARLFAAQFGNDVEDLGINGDTAAGAGPDQDFLTIDNGWMKIAKTETAFNKYDTNASTDYKGVVFQGMLRAMPDRWKRNKSMLKFLVSPTVEEDYRLSLADRQTALGDRQLTDAAATTYAGIEIIAVPSMADTDLLLTPIKNLAYGIHEREIRVGKQVQERKRLVEYTTTARVDFQWIKPEAAVVAWNQP